MEVTHLTLSSVSRAMAYLPLYFTVSFLIVVSCGQQAGTADNVTSDMNGTSNTNRPLLVNGEAGRITTPDAILPQTGNVSEETKNLTEASAITETAGKEDPQSITKNTHGEELKRLFIAEPDAIKKDLGGKCSKDNDCSSVNNTNCKDNICVCNDGFIPSKHNMNKCVKVPNGMFDMCDEDAQCEHTVPASECRTGQCQCPLNYIFKQNRCWEKQKLGGFCNVTKQCEDVNLAICIQGVCDCQTPFIPSPNNKCLQVAGKEYKAICEEDIQCNLSYGDEARCSHGQCLCTNNYHYNGTTCISDKKLGESCTADEECEVSKINSNEEELRICLDKICSCAIGYSKLTGEDICSTSSGHKFEVPLYWILCFQLIKFITQ